MNSSVQFVQSERVAQNPVVYCYSGRETNSKMMLDAIYLPRRATRPEVSSALAILIRRFFSVSEALGEQRLPPLPQAVMCSDHGPQVIRFVEGEDTPKRRRALEARMSQLGAERGRKLLVRRKQGELDSQLGRARAWATELAARGPVHPIIIGIDGMDLWLTSLRHAAFQLRAMLDVGATVVCAVDARYEDSHLLTFYLRTLGIKVIREPLLPKKLPGVSAGLKTSRLSPDAENGEPTGLFPDVQTPALSAYVAELRNPTRHMARDIQTSQRELKRRRAREGAALSALAEYERAKYERAYRNGFAVSRLRREWSL